MLSSELVRAELACRGVAVILALTAPSAAEVEDPFALGSARESSPEPRLPPARTARSSVGYQHWLGGLYLGKGLRWNNPYRLRRQLGDNAESLSLGATYLDLHLGRTFSRPYGFEHGVALHFSIATDGIRQEVATPSYLLLKRFSPRWLGYGRAGFPLVLEPDLSVGLEAGLGVAYFFTANLGLGVELDQSLFYGAATIEKAVTLIPVSSLALGVFVDWERLP
jgi:hypothetical protein